MDTDQRNLEEFKQLNELLRFYTNLVLQTVTFVLSATGAVVAYVVKDPIMPRNAPYGFAIPAALCLGMGLGFLLNIRPAIQLRKRLTTLTDTLGFGLAPHARSLIGSLSFFGALLTVTGVVLFVLYMKLRP